MQPVLLMNPKKRGAKKHRGARTMTARQAQFFAKNPKRRHHRHHFRRNPRHISAGSLSTDFSTRGITGALGPAMTGAAGALMLDWAFANLPLPTFLTQGLMLTVSRIGGAIVIGAIAARVGGRDFGHKAAAGALVVTSYSIIKGFLQTNMPSLALARYVPMQGLVALGRGGGGHASPGGVRRVAGMGYLNAAMIAGPLDNAAGSHLSRYNVIQSRY